MGMLCIIGVFGVAFTACLASEGLSMWFIKRVGYRVLQQHTNATVLRKFQCMLNCASDRRCVGFAFIHVEHFCALYYDDADSQHVTFIPDPTGEAYLKCKWSFISNRYIDIDSFTTCSLCIRFAVTKSYNDTRASMISWCRSRWFTFMVRCLRSYYCHRIHFKCWNHRWKVMRRPDGRTVWHWV